MTDRIIGIAEEAQALLRELALPAVPGERVAAAINRAAHRSGLSAARVKCLWYGNAKAILAVEMDQLRSKAGRNVGGAGNDTGKSISEILHRIDRLVREIEDVRADLARAISASRGSDGSSSG